MRRVELYIGDSPASRELLDCPEFVAVLKNPKPHISEVLRYIVDPKRTFSEKNDAVLMMSRLSIDDRILFGETVLILAEQHRLSDSESDREILEEAVIPDADWSTELVESYRDKTVRAYLLKLKASPCIKCKSYIDDILSGDRADHLQDMKNADLYGRK